MKKSQAVFNLISENRLIALLSPDSEADCLGAYEVLHPLGIVLEVAFRTRAAAAGLRAVKNKYPEALLLAGTVLTREQVREAVSAGAAGVVSSDYFPEVVEECVAADIMVVPGGLSDCGKQLAQKAVLYGCGLFDLRDRYPYQWIYKLFPAVAGAHIFADLARAWRGPYQGLTVLYTGGINLKNLALLNRTDPTGIFCGSALTAGKDQPGGMAAEARKWVEALKPALRPGSLGDTTVNLFDKKIK